MPRGLVAPFTGAWVETRGSEVERHPGESRPSRARGLKQGVHARAGKRPPSRPSRARGLKPDIGEMIDVNGGRALHGRVG